MTITFFFKFYSKNTQIRRFWSKIPKSIIFGLKFRHFSFSAKFCNQTNSRLLIPNMTVLLTSSSSKILKSDIFCLIFRRFCFLNKFSNYSNFKVLISNMTIVFFNFSLKIPKLGIFGEKYLNKAFLVTNSHFHFCRKFCIYKNSKVLILNMAIGF